MINRLALAVLALVLSATALADFPVIDMGNIKPNDPKMRKPIDKSKEGELTIVSYNIRNLGSRRRSLKDFGLLADVMNEGDIVFIQEAGLGVHSGSTVTSAQRRRMNAAQNALQASLGGDWVVTRPPLDHPASDVYGRRPSLPTGRRGKAIS